MAKRLLLAVTCAWLLAAATALADVPATIVLRSGERVTGDLVDLNARGYSMRVSGQVRTIRPVEVAMIQFADPGDLSTDAQGKLAAGQQFVVLRNGGTADGRLVDIGGRSPLRLTFETQSGATRNLTSAQVAIIYLARVGQSPGQAGGQAPSSATKAVPAGPGQRAFTVPGHEAWTSTYLIFEEGDVVGFRATGQVRLSPRPSDVVSAGGAPLDRAGPGVPLPAAARGALLGRIDAGQPFMVGAERSLRMPARGILYLGVNDDLTSDNGGELQVTDTVLPRRR